MIAATTAVATPVMGPLPCRNSAPNGCPRASHPCGQMRGRGDGKTAYLGWSAPSLADCGADTGPGGRAISGPRARLARPAAVFSARRLIEQANSKTPARAGVGNVAWCRWGSPALRRVPIVDVLADLIFGQTVALLDLALELISAAVDDVKIVVGELTPLLLHLPFDLLPISLHAIPVHFDRTSCVFELRRENAGVQKTFRARELLVASSVLPPLTSLEARGSDADRGRPNSRAVGRLWSQHGDLNAALCRLHCCKEISRC